VISFGILLRKLEFFVAEFGIFTLRKSGISFCGFWKKHLPFLDFQFAIIGKLTCGKQYRETANKITKCLFARRNHEGSGTDQS
jgi:hypothetical protein